MKYLNNILFENIRPTKDKIIDDISLVNRLYHNYYIRNTEYNKLITILKNIEVLHVELEEEDKEHAIITGEHKKAILPDSREVSAPASLSESTARNRKYSSSYHRHAKYSEKREIHELLPPLPDKTRQQVLRDLKQGCRETIDILSQRDFSRFPKRSLQLVVGIGKGTKKQCYFVRDLYRIWKDSVHANTPFKNPTTNEVITDDEMDEIMNKIKYIKYDATDLRNLKVMKPSKKFEFKAAPVNINGIIYYKMEIIRKINTSIYTIFHLGYIPANLETTDFVNEDGTTSLDISSSNLVVNIKKLFDDGKLLSSNVAPYSCCKVHLFKSPDYWIRDSNVANDTDTYIKGINRRRFLSMMDEVNIALGLPHIAVY